MHRVPVFAGKAISAGRDPSGVMELGYKDGHVCRFEDVPADLFQSFLQSAAQDDIVENVLKPNYRWEECEAAE